MKDVYEKDLSIVEQCTGYPDGENEINGVADEDARHNRKFYDYEFSF